MAQNKYEKMKQNKRKRIILTKIVLVKFFDSRQIKLNRVIKKRNDFCKSRYIKFAQKRAKMCTIF